MSRFLTTAVLSCLSTSAVAQDICTHSPVIAQMTDYVLRERDELSSLKQANFGDTAAFLAIRYDGADPQLVLDGLENDSTRAPRLRDDLRGAYDLSQEDGLLLWQVGGPEVLDRFLGILPSTRRALLLADEGETYFNLLSQIKADEAFAERAAQNPAFEIQSAFATGDQSDDVRIAIAQRAEDGGHMVSAAALLGDLVDPSPLDAFLLRHPDAVTFRGMEMKAFIALSTIGTLNGDSPLQGPRDGNIVATVRDLQFFTSMKSALVGPSSDFLNMYLNQTGQVELVSLAGQTLIDAIEVGEVDPTADPEDAWLLTYRVLLNNSDPALVHHTLGSFNWPSQSIRSYTGYAVESLDVMLAKDALGPYMRQETRILPDMPVGYSGSRDWERWTEIAALIRASTYPDTTPDDLMMTLELLWETGFYMNAYAVAANQPDTDAALAFMRDAMVRLDAKCGDYMGVPGDAIRYGGMAIYRFD